MDADVDNVELTTREKLALVNLSRSYPFMDLARICRVSYSDVLIASYVFDHWRGEDTGFKSMIFISEAVDRLPRRVRDVIRQICDARWRWQFPPQGRGL